MNSSIEKFVKLENCAFSEPEYFDYQIRYVESEKVADVCVDPCNALSDYLALGFVSLARSVQNKPGIIRVCNFTEAFEEINVMVQGRRVRHLKENRARFVQIAEPIGIIGSHLYKGREITQFWGFGLSAFCDLTLYFSGLNTLPVEVMRELKYENFDDIITAQKNAFFLMNVIYDAYMNGNKYNV